MPSSVTSGAAPKQKTVAEMMASGLTILSLNDELDHALHLMTEGRMHHLPVIEKGVAGRSDSRW
jgi:signal-transduction protein with cAMP-binding, CBS, and nucleotidyltransferase domain